MTREIGVYICECGTNIAEKVDIDKVISELSVIKDVAVIKKYKLLCSNDGQKYLKQEIEEQGLTHVVIAACSPKQHEMTFMNICEQAGINPQLFHLVNIREQCAWVTSDGAEATAKAIRQTRAAINRVRYHASLEKKELECLPDVLVIGGGIAGIKASQLLAAPDRKVYLVERESVLGGKIRNFTFLYTSMESCSELIDREIKSLLDNKNVDVLTDSEIEQILGFLGNFEVDIVNKKSNESRKCKVGAVVLATGFESFDVSKLPQYGYGKLDNVYMGLEFESMNAPDGSTEGRILMKNGQPPKSVAVIHCVGREETGYCSKVCCLYSLKFDRMIKSQLSKASTTHFYSDLCLPGKTFQKFFEDTKQMGIELIRSVNTEVSESVKGINIKYEKEDGAKDELGVDMVILLTAMEPGNDSNRLAEMLKLQQDERGFFEEEHPLLSPIASAVEGVFIAGCAQGPKGIIESIVNAEAAAGKILSTLVPGRKLQLEVRTSEISETFCTGCKTCIDVCPYGAITFNKAKRISVINEALCHGCGNCAAACPSGAAKLKHFTFPQLYQELQAVLR